MDARTRIQELERENVQLRERLQQQEDANAQLHRQVKRWEGGLREWNGGLRVAPRRARRGGKGASNTQPGRKRGHGGSGRPYPGEAEVEREVHHSLRHCPGCSQPVVPTGVVKTHYVEEVVPARRRVVAHRRYGYFCPGCAREGVAPLPAELGPAPKLDIGVHALVVSLHYEYGLSYGQIAAYLAQHCEFPLSTGAIAQICTRTAQRTAGAEQELQAMAQQSPVLHMDETTWWTEGVLHYVWLVATAAFSWFRVDARRSHQVIVEMLGQETRIVVSDFYSAYRACTWLLHQWCWAHLIRDAKRVAEVAPSAARAEFRDRLVAIYKAAIEAQSRAGPQGPQARRVICQRLGRVIRRPPYTAGTELQRPQTRVEAAVWGLPTVLEHPEGPPANHRAQTDFRPARRLRQRRFLHR